MYCQFFCFCFLGFPKCLSSPGVGELAPPPPLPGGRGAVPSANPPAPCAAFSFSSSGPRWDFFNCHSHSCCRNRSSLSVSLSPRCFDFRNNGRRRQRGECVILLHSTRPSPKGETRRPVFPSYRTCVFLRSLPQTRKESCACGCVCMRGCVRVNTIRATEEEQRGAPARLLAEDAKEHLLNGTKISRFGDPGVRCGSFPGPG